MLEIVASGGEDDLAYIWKRGSGEVEHMLENWGDSVNQLAWSNDGGMLAASDMAGLVKVFRVPGFQQIWSFEVGDILVSLICVVSLVELMRNTKFNLSG